ncbi:helix-turn-helix transcriptional regulator [Saccharothrix deserti]|uniref:helix-turn-helix transcriptional regulator n=1 Tax=Saccharothrix deserti TaxID=2593674 RepID=UPI00192E40ED
MFSTAGDPVALESPRWINCPVRGRMAEAVLVVIQRQHWRRCVQAKAGSRTRRLKTREVAEVTGIPESTLRAWRHRNRGPESYTLCGSVVYDEDQLNAWIAEQKAQSVRGGTRESVRARERRRGSRQ